VSETQIYQCLTRLTTYYFVFSDDFVKSAVKLKEYQGVKYNTVARNITGLIPPGSTGVNHGEYIKFSFIHVTFVHRAL
jgi:hypothetical protein